MGEELYWEWNEGDGRKDGVSGLDSEIKSETLRRFRACAPAFGEWRRSAH